MASGPVIAWPMRAITSAPNVACRLIVEATAATAPLRRSTSVATTVVVPMSNETPNIRSRVSPGSTSTRWSPTTVAVSVVTPSSSTRARRGRIAGPCETSSPSSTRASCTRRRWLRASSRLGSSSSSSSFCTFGSSSTNRPTPIVAAFGVRIRRGTSHTVSSFTSAWHDRRQPSSSLSERCR